MDQKNRRNHEGSSVKENRPDDTVLPGQIYAVACLVLLLLCGEKNQKEARAGFLKVK